MPLSVFTSLASYYKRSNISVTLDAECNLDIVLYHTTSGFSYCINPVTGSLWLVLGNAKNNILTSAFALCLEFISHAETTSSFTKFFKSSSIV